MGMLEALLGEAHPTLAECPVLYLLLLLVPQILWRKNIIQQVISFH